MRWRVGGLRVSGLPWAINSATRSEYLAAALTRLIDSSRKSGAFSDGAVSQIWLHTFLSRLPVLAVFVD